MPRTHQLVRTMLACHLDRAVCAIQPWQRLDRDLDLTPLELVLLALEFEEIQQVRVSMDGLVGASTVGDLFALFARALAEG
jgi:hypothetical protein